MGYNSKSNDKYTVISIDEPRLDASKAESFKRYVDELIDSGVSDFIIDLSSVTFMDSSGLGVIVGILKRLKEQGTVQLAGPQQAVQELFQLTCMDKIFEIYNSLAEAEKNKE